jgi:hypothetical protein
MNAKKLYKCLPALLIFVFAQTDIMCQTQQAKINYTSFTVNAVKKRVTIDWVTDNKVPANYFEIQRSADGINFKTIALVLGPDPQKINCDCYECFDKPGAGTKKYFYRLKHISTDGEIELSETKMLAINK